MAKNISLSRRRFVLGGALFTGVTVAGLQFYRSAMTSPAEQVVNSLIERLSKLPGAVRFGELYRQQQQEIKKPVVSVKLISDRLFVIDDVINEVSMNKALERQMQIELSANQVYLVDDWYLTRTEAELCALASIISFDASPSL